MTAARKTKSSVATSAQSPVSMNLTSDAVDVAPVIYADSLVHLGMGPFISKATFAVQGSAGNKLLPNLVLTMPTNQMFEAARYIMMAVVGPESREGFQKNWDAFLDSIQVPPAE